MLGSFTIQLQSYQPISSRDSIYFQNSYSRNKKEWDDALRPDLQIISKKGFIHCISEGLMNEYCVENNSYWRKRLYYKDGSPVLFRRVNFTGGSNNNKTIISAEYKGVKSNISGALIIIQLGAKIKYGNTQIGELIL